MNEILYAVQHENKFMFIKKNWREKKKKLMQAHDLHINMLVVRLLSKGKSNKNNKKTNDDAASSSKGNIVRLIT